MILKKIGSVGVDSGQVFITDPCYIKHTEQGNGQWNVEKVENENGEIEWVSQNDPTLDNKQNFYTKVCEANMNGVNEVELGVVTSTTHGDGEYSVMGIFDEEDDIMLGLFIDFDGRIDAKFDYEDKDEWY